MTDKATTTEARRHLPRDLVWPEPILAEHFDFASIEANRFAARVLDQRLRHSAQGHWATSATSLDAVLPYALSTTRTEHSRSAVVDLSRALGHPALGLVVLRRGTANVSVATDEQPVLAEAEGWLRDMLPVAEPTRDRHVPVSFWCCGSYGASATSRRIGVPEWEEIRHNYPDAVRQKLGQLVGPAFRPAGGGQLLLWHGEPGTGKTFALRALAWEWRAWCDVHYVTDPDAFFGERSDYMMEVLLDQEEDDGRWRLLVLEDTGELLAADAKERTGQGLSRLLNVVDGLLGQGLRVLVLVTANESLRSLHPAVARPGRCAARIEFKPFPPDQAAAWLEARGVSSHGARAATVASLYARMRGEEDDAPPVRGKTGFVS